MTYPSAKDAIIRVEGSAVRSGRNTVYSAISTATDTVATTARISSGHGKAPNISVEAAATDGTTSE